MDKYHFNAIATSLRAAKPELSKTPGMPESFYTYQNGMYNQWKECCTNLCDEFMNPRPGDREYHEFDADEFLIACGVKEK